MLMKVGGKMKKILIVSDSLRMGGIQTSLKSCLKKLSKQDYDITLFLFNDSNKESLNIDNVNVISGTKLLKIISYTAEEAKNKGIFIFILRKILALLCKIFTSNIVYGFIFMFEKKIGNYDFAISYSNNISDRAVYFGYNKFVLKMVNASHKIAYIHADYDTIHFNISDKEYTNFDSIWCVSEFVKKSFLKHNPDLADKCNVVYNFIDEERIENITTDPYPNNKFHIITIGRLDQNKSQIDAINICLKLIEKNVDFNWYFLGDGPERKRIEDAIFENKLSDHVYLLGNKNNVGDYLNYGDVFVSLSKSESYGLAIAEALLLNKITIVRDMPVAHEIIQNNGIICKNDQEIVDTLYNLITNQEYYKECKQRSKLYYDNEKNLNHINNLLNMRK